MNDFPKVELHLHLEGAAPPALIRGLAREKNIDISKIFAEDGGYHFKDYHDFLKVYEAAATALTRPEDYQRLTRAVLEQSLENGVVYTEAFIAPDFCGGGDLGAWREYLIAIDEEAARLEREGGITLRLIAAAIRHADPARGRRAALCAAETVGGRLVGFGLGGNERYGRPQDFAWAFDLAREAGLRLTAHAGEREGPKSIRDILSVLGVERIGQGFRAIEDLALVDELAERGIVLELCPGSNVAMELVRDWRAHPIRSLYEREVKVTISTDHPAYLGTSMRHEYDRLADLFDQDAGVLAKINRTALDAAFCDADTRERISKILEPGHA